MRFSSVVEGAVGAGSTGSAKAVLSVCCSIESVYPWWPENYHVSCIKCRVPLTVGESDRGLWLSLNQYDNRGSGVIHLGDQAPVIEATGVRYCAKN